MNTYTLVVFPHLCTNGAGGHGNYRTAMALVTMRSLNPFVNGKEAAKANLWVSKESAAHLACWPARTEWKIRLDTVTQYPPWRRLGTQIGVDFASRWCSHG